jgi:hypothetical protein
MVQNSEKNKTQIIHGAPDKDTKDQSKIYTGNNYSDSIVIVIQGKNDNICTIEYYYKPYMNAFLLHPLSCICTTINIKKIIEPTLTEYNIEASPENSKYQFYVEKENVLLISGTIEDHRSFNVCYMLNGVGENLEVNKLSNVVMLAQSFEDLNYNSKVVFHHYKILHLPQHGTEQPKKSISSSSTELDYPLKLNNPQEFRKFIEQLFENFRTHVEHQLDQVYSYEPIMYKSPYFDTKTQGMDNSQRLLLFCVELLAKFNTIYKNAYHPSSYNFKYNNHSNVNDNNTSTPVLVSFNDNMLKINNTKLNLNFEVIITPELEINFGVKMEMEKNKFYIFVDLNNHELSQELKFVIPTQPSSDDNDSSTLRESNNIYNYNNNNNMSKSRIPQYISIYDALLFVKNLMKLKKLQKTHNFM